MQANKKDEELSDYAKCTIRHKARSLVGKVGFTNSDIKDIEQEMALDLIQRMPKFDPNKAAHTTISARVIDRKLSKIIRHRTQEMRDFRRETCSLNDLLEDSEGETIERACTIDQDEGDLRTGKRHRAQAEEAQLSIDVSLVLSALPEDLKPIAERLRTETITEVAVSLGIPRATLYGARNRLRRIFENAGLRQYL